MTNKNYKVILNGQSFIVRIAGNGTDRFIDRTAEKKTASLLKFWDLMSRQLILMLKQELKLVNLSQVQKHWIQ